MVQPEGRQEIPRGRTFTAERIVGKLREAEVGFAQTKTLPAAVRKRGVKEQTSYRWKWKDRGLRTDQVKRLKDLGKKNVGLSRLRVP